MSIKDASKAKIDPAEHYGFVYVMFSRDHNVSKFGFSISPHARLHQARAERKDESIELVAMWSIWCCGDFNSPSDIENLFHCWLSPLSMKHPSQSWCGEWYGVYWPNLVDYVESCAAMLAAIDILMRRGTLS